MRASAALAESIIGLAGGRLWPSPDCLLNPYAEAAGKWYRSAAVAPTIAPITPAISSFRAKLSAMAVPPRSFFEILFEGGQSFEVQSARVSARSGEVEFILLCGCCFLSPHTIEAVL